MTSGVRQQGGQRRSAGGAGRVAGLDGVRGLAVTLVVLSHAHIPYFGPGGIEGVTTFFTLSGFLISGLMLKEQRETGRLDLPAFWGRRALRLLPALFTFVAVTCLFFWVAGWAKRADLVSWATPVLFYYGNFHLNAHGLLGPFRHTWSLAVEEQFYLVWPLLLAPALFLLRGRRRAWLWLLAGMAALTAGSLTLRLVAGLAGPQGGWVGVAPQTTVFSMTAGACLAVIYDRGWRPGRWAAPVALVTLTAYFWLPEVIPPVWAAWVVGPAIYTCLALVLLACTAGEIRTVFSWRPLRALGTVSYGWYLWHFPFLYVILLHAFKVRHQGIAVYLCIITSLLVAAMSWQYVERPLQRRFRGRLERTQLTARPAAVEPLPADGGVPVPVGDGGVPVDDGAGTDPGVPDGADVTAGPAVGDLTVLERPALR